MDIMNAGNLDTTNLLLGIMAAVSVLEALLLIGVGRDGLPASPHRPCDARRPRNRARQIAPLVARWRVDETRGCVLADVKDVTARGDRTGVSMGVAGRWVASTGRGRVAPLCHRDQRVLTLVIPRAVVDGF